MMKIRLLYSAGKKKHRGQLAFTMIEAVIAFSLSLLISASIMYLYYTSARIIKDIYGPTRSRTARMIAFDVIRYQLSDAKQDTCVVEDSGHLIKFKNPNIAAAASAFQYVAKDKAGDYGLPDDRALYFFPDYSKKNEFREVVQGPINISFTLGSKLFDKAHGYTMFVKTGSFITLNIRTSSDLAYSNVDIRDGETGVFLRNR
jgi:hypothetical protein